MKNNTYVSLTIHIATPLWHENMDVATVRMQIMIARLAPTLMYVKRTILMSLSVINHYIKILSYYYNTAICDIKVLYEFIAKGDVDTNSLLSGMITIIL